MLERLTARSQRVLALAREEARGLHHSFVGPEHLLLGLAGEGDGIAARALRRLGVAPDAVRHLVEETVGPTRRPPARPFSLTPRARRVLELARREALERGDPEVDTGHLLLGIVQEGGGVAGEVLRAVGAPPERVRREVVAVRVEYPDGESRPSTPDERTATGSSPVHRPPDDASAGERGRAHDGGTSAADEGFRVLERCSLCGGDLWEAGHFVAAGNVRVCERCVRAAVRSLDDAPPTPRQVTLPPRVSGGDADEGMAEAVTTAVLEAVGIPDGYLPDVGVALAGQVPDHLTGVRRAIWQRLRPVAARVSRIRFTGPGDAEARVHVFSTALGVEVVADLLVHRAGGHWYVDADALGDLVEGEGAGPSGGRPPSGGRRAHPTDGSDRRPWRMLQRHQSGRAVRRRSQRQPPA